MRAGGTPPRSNPAYWNGDIPYVKIEDITNANDGHITATNEFISQQGIEQSSAWVVSPGHVLLSMYASIGAVAINDIPVATNQAIIAIEPDPVLVCAEFLLYSLRSRAADLESRNIQTTQRNVNAGIVRDFAIPVPPLDEQRRIARILSTIQTVRSSERVSADSRRRLRASLAAHLLEPQAEWQRAVAFQDVVQIVSGQVDPREEPYASLPHIAPDNIESNSGRLLPVRSAGDLGLISGKYTFELGDVLYSKIRPYLNKAALAPFRGTCSADMYVLRGDPRRLKNEYLLYVLLSDDFLLQATSHQNRTGIPKVNRQELASIQLDLPPIETQEKVARYLMIADAALTQSLEVEAAIGRVFESALARLLEPAA